MIIDVFALLCGLSVMAFSATANDKSAWGWWFAGFLSAAIIINPALLAVSRPPMLGFDAIQFSMLILLVSSWIMNNYRKASIPLFMSGILSVVWISSLTLQGLPLPAAMILVIAAALVCIWASLHRPGFSSRLLEDEANIIVLCFSLALIIVPETLSGWESAATLQDRDSSLSNYRENVPIVLLISGLFIILGGFYAKWKQK